MYCLKADQLAFHGQQPFAVSASVETYGRVCSFLKGLSDAASPTDVDVTGHRVEDIRYDASAQKGKWPKSHGVRVSLEDLSYVFDNIPMLSIEILSGNIANPLATDLIHHPAIRLPYLQILFEKIERGEDYLLLHITFQKVSKKKGGNSQNPAKAGVVFFTESRDKGRLERIKSLL